MWMYLLATVQKEWDSYTEMHYKLRADSGYLLCSSHVHLSTFILHGLEFEMFRCSNVFCIGSESSVASDIKWTIQS